MRHKHYIPLTPTYATVIYLQKQHDKLYHTSCRGGINGRVCMSCSSSCSAISTSAMVSATSLSISNNSLKPAYLPSEKGPELEGPPSSMPFFFLILKSSSLVIFTSQPMNFNSSSYLCVSAGSKRSLTGLLLRR
ncbi:hypothetical protein IHE45_12G017100 [Dioscorea alata]|uniref:Uncharacterized protein n=1 Tax=Dioscorea alata TaxID=55571 RepID=A0ACB7V0C3_DIOAL|nr:hypothetical protein IHE45_12G017100 [Dioscorea alata]